MIPGEQHDIARTKPPQLLGGAILDKGGLLRNNGVEKLPAPFGQEGEHTVVLRNHAWNHMVWEIGNVARDKVTSLEILYEMDGNEPEAADTSTFYFSRLELERVEPAYIEGR